MGEGLSKSDGVETWFNKVIDFWRHEVNCGDLCVFSTLSGSLNRICISDIYNHPIGNIYHLYTT